MRDVKVRICKPVIRGLRTQDGSPYALGRWEWAARCVEHGTSWTTGGKAKWADAFNAAMWHQREWAEPYVSEKPDSAT